MERDQQLKSDALKEILKYKDEVESDPYRLHYHVMPPVGLLNDPNGFIQWKGTYHLFYQWMPFKTGHGPKFWGHYTSKDLVHWQEEPIALAPSDWFDKDGCYSGSAIIHQDQMYLFYTGNVKREDGTRESYQCVAISKDGVHFEKKGPVITLPNGYTPHFRDPKVWQGKDELWYMVIGAQKENLEGDAVLYQSHDLENWEFLGSIMDKDLSLGYMWECPDYFELNGKGILLFSPQGLKASGFNYQNVYQSGYVIGDMNEQNKLQVQKGFCELDRGFEFYAPQTMLDEQSRRILIGWMGVPDQDEDKQPTIDHKWVHSMTLPRQLTWKEDKLYQTPVKELETLRSKMVNHSDLELDVNEQFSFELENSASEIEAKINSEGTSLLEINIRDNVRIIFNSNQKLFTLERKSYVDGLVERRQCILDHLSHLQIFLDTSSIEVFVNKGEEVFTARFFPYKGKDVRIRSIGEKKIQMEVTCWTIKRDR
ncbi:sucrose-6-phosphate hydrolase [Aquibacillus koreensis]|uniref:Sucrose-6-phosphate hydrolase n=1 Tax=Aquibacillus koreensis TaxID=279446 RepID=A0A9X3WPE4_9BACI|nr:sucrose-6-phosphate hydrolase [Aquibacillus koreensis]MCT2537827.1 sucrose-6-phosphate hydrolase [Aquibacillus koreensis]MDC3421141.1 sucrose-6-phosphate hydrolase [Aquibacillus koreensis]